MMCSKCGHANTVTAEFCLACHNPLLFKCPKCWHEQRRQGTCDKCGVNMALAWKVQAASAMAAAVREEATNLESSGQNLSNNIRMVEMAVFSPTSFLAVVGLRFGWHWFSRLWSRQ